jgi:hypothetical protein
VFRTDSLVDVAFLFVPKAVQYIPAQNIHVAGLGYLVPEVHIHHRLQLRDAPPSPL